MVMLGLGGSGHDWSSCVISGGTLVALDEERVTRKKYGLGADLLAGASRQAVLGDLGATLDDVTQAACCDLVPRSFRFALRDRITVINHHLAHAYSTFAASGFTRAAILVCDNSGSLSRGGKAQPGAGREAETISVYVGTPDGITLVDKVTGAHYVDATTESAYYQPGLTDNSLGHFYRSASLAIGLGFQPPGSPYPVSEDGKTMGLAPYGDDRFVADIADLVGLEPGGGISCSAAKADHLFERLARPATLEVRSAIAFAAQHTLERALLHCARSLRERTGEENLCIAGGVGLNSVANGRILREAGFGRLYVVPAAGDNGIALGCAYYAAHQLAGVPMGELPALADAYLGPRYPPKRVEAAVDASGLPWERPDDLPDRAAALLADGKVVGWFDGRSEFGPRALGHRSILAAPFPAGMRDYLNDTVKHREWFRPYAPVVPVDRYQDYFDIGQPSPFMLVVAGVTRPDEIPAVSHVDGTARLQTLAEPSNPRLHAVLRAFETRTGCPVLLNTSFNVAGEPIVETPEDALRSFAAMPLDHLVIGDRILSRPNLAS